VGLSLIVWKTSPVCRLSISVPSHTDLVNLCRQLFSTEVGRRETVQKLRLLNGYHFFIFQSTLPFDFFVVQFKYIYDPKSLWSRDLVLNLEPSTTPYDDANEDQGVKVQDILRFEDLHEPSLEYWVYDGHSITDVSGYGNVEPPLKDMSVRRFISSRSTSNSYGAV
jgi:hypothetical protein